MDKIKKEREKFVVKDEGAQRKKKSVPTKSKGAH